MKKLLPIILLFFASELVFAQGFNSRTGRNHPELNWQVAETEHFLIMYPERISGIQHQAAPIAEKTYDALSKNLEIEFDYKIRIYLSAEDEINNGFAVPFHRAFTNIWVNLNDYSELFSGQEKWLRKVIAHELAHIFHFEAIRTDFGLLQFAFWEPLPSFWTEGLAQYQTEKWDSQRGDRWLRKAVFDDDMNYQSGQSIEDGRLLYALGNSQLRYFTEKYGDSTLVGLLSHRDKLLGLIEYHDFGNAFNEVIDGGYQAFYDEWRKHTNVYYNTVASQMERVDSLEADPFNFPGQFYYDAAISPNDSLIAVLSLTAMSRPVRRLYIIKNDSTRKTREIGEGGINSDLNWSADNNQLIYSRLVRGKHSSLINDVFRYDVEADKEERLTFNRRARFPVFSPRDGQIVFVANEGGTGNLFSLNLNTGKEERITNYTGDVQVLWPQWIPNQNKWLIHRFEKDGSRHLVLVDPVSEEDTIIDSGKIDNRKAVLSPDGNKIAYTSFRDEVPNVFIYDFEAEKESRYTNLFTGGEVFGWVADLDTTGKEHLLIGASESRRNDKLFFVNADRTVFQPDIEIPKNYASWRFKAPPNMIESNIEPNPGLIQDTYKYRSLRNLTHVTTFGLPYYQNQNDWGLFATTSWAEPLGKHSINGGGWLSIPEPAKHSYGAFSYLNNQLYPSLSFTLYRIPENGQFYGSHFLIEEYTGGDITANWPLDFGSVPYLSSSISAKISYYSTKPFDAGRFTGHPGIAEPQSATVSDVQLSWQVKKQRPWKDNSFHPIDGSGLKVSISASEKVFGSDISALTADINSYTIIPFIGLNRIFLQGRIQAQWGNSLPQSYIGFSRYDNISVRMPEGIPVQFFADNDRVRGYKEFISGNQVGFGSIEYRMPFIPSLQTQILGILRLGGVSFSLFTDAGVVRQVTSNAGEGGSEYRWGAGAELKNNLSLFGFNIAHGIGLAQPAEKLFTNHSVDFYYRVKTVIPF